MRVAVMGAGEAAAAQSHWYRQAGHDVGVSPGLDEACLTADLIDLCLDGALSEGAWRALLRHRRPVLARGAAAPLGSVAVRRARLAALGRLAVVGGWRFVPAFARLREFVVGGILGRVRAVRVEVSAPDAAAGCRPGALDLGLWLAGDAPDAVAVACHPAATALGLWTVTLEAERGQARAAAAFAIDRAGRRCRDQRLEVTLDGRRRAFPDLPDTDPAGNELGATLARLATGQPWLGLCSGSALAALMSKADNAKVAPTDAAPG